MENRSDWEVLLIDDEADIREVMALTLRDAGYRVATAADGEAGLFFCREHPPHIVITDIRMPKMDGIQVLEAVKSRYPDTEVIVITAFGEMDLAIRALQLDASDFVSKPINTQALHLALRRARDRYAARRQIRDYTDLLERENARTAEELNRSIELRRNLVEHALDGIVMCDRGGTVVTVNRSLEGLLDISRAAVLGKKTLEDLFAPGEADRFREHLASDLYGGPDRLMIHETGLLNGQGQRVPVQVSAAVVKAADGGGELVCFFKDLRELRALERDMADQARILHQDKMMSLGRLAASVVHEINNPLSGILNYLRLMIRIIGRGPVDADQQEKFGQYLDLVARETERCSRIVSGLLAFSRKSKAVREPVRIPEVLDRCVALSRHKLELSNIILNTDIASDMPSVIGDFNQLQQCVINLIFNAIDAMPTGGNLLISAGSDSNGRSVQITVNDSGHGIAKDDMPRLFEPFFTTKREGQGVGLGLSTVFGIVESFGGSVSVDSRPGQGAAFTIRLPVSGQE